MLKNLLLLSVVFLLFFSGSTGYIVDGYKPIYVPASEAKTIKVMEPREVENQGKIYIKDQYIYIGDVERGVHIIDNSDSTNPQKIAFIQIYGNHDIAIKENILYADNLDDLVALDITDLQNIQISKRIEGVYQLPSQTYPENVAYGTYFECTDPDRGIVVGWTPAQIEDPECWTSY
ncbi:MAG: hypothetical protein R2764_15225 [Bacteroidales bacterium]